jgi:alanyl-tRNA synthetase
MWSSENLRESFLEFFEGKGHLRLPSFSLIPVNDPTLLLIGAGMAPLKPYFRGDEEPPSKRVTTCQKCVRADDIERVGLTSRHHTFFEMLGNFSFGDYFKKDAALWGWEYLSKILGLDPGRLWVSIHIEDDEAFEIWKNDVGVPQERIVRLSDNFWGPIGLTGPCGPCSELYYDRGEAWGCGEKSCLPGCDCDRYMEVWNLVFTGLNKIESGEFLNLPARCIDTGLGFERLLMLMQDRKSPFETELFSPVIKAIEELSGKRMEGPSEVPMKIVADHVRAVTFMIADGIGPSNEGRGYVLRRILRRASRLGKVLKMGANFLSALVEPVVSVMGGVYPGVLERREYVRSIVRQEEENFDRTLEGGSALLSEMMDKHLKKGEKTLPGEEVFRLYDTYGFPWELTREMARERGLAVDEAAFKQLLEEQKERARADQEAKLSSLAGASMVLKAEKTDFTGYRELSSSAEILAILKNGDSFSEALEGEAVDLILNRTPFYGESGGQVGDRGRIDGPSGRADIEDTLKTPEGLVVHRGQIVSGKLTVGDEVELQVDPARRRETARHHSATHLLQEALREVLGKHVSQAGSLVGPESFRFDFSHFKALSHAELEQVEGLVNAGILENLPVLTEEISHEEALRRGALAFFGEKYGAVVRLVSMGSFSRELCGGTHVNSTGEIGCVKILSEGAISSGIRRIEGLAGLSALRFFQSSHDMLRGFSQEFKVSIGEVPQAVERLQAQTRESARKLAELEREISDYRAEELLRKIRERDGVSFIVARVSGVTIQALRELGDRLREKMKSVAVVLGCEHEGKAALLAMVSRDLVQKGLAAGKIISEIAPLVDGRGGGRPDMAQAGGKNPAGLEAALKKAEEMIGGNGSNA